MRSYRLSIPLRGPQYGHGRLALPKTGPRRGSSPSPPVLSGKPSNPLYRLLMYFWIMVLVSVAGCATVAPDIQTGLRSAYHEVQVHKVMVLPVQQPSPFGMSAQEQETLLALYSDTLAQRLRSAGFEVVPQAQVQAALKQLDMEEVFALQGDSLGQVLEQKPEAQALQDRADMIKKLGQTLGADAAMWSQVLYHSEATCDPTQTSDYTSHVVLVDEAPKGESPVPCAISHFEAGLVFTSTGQTLWYNKALRELRASTSDSPTPDAHQNARDTVGLVMMDQDAGLPSMRASR